ncbi:MAG TPA: hypothetical protein VKV39_05185 [Candidatus Sulfotelmatobacter sp.]|nr:hypothetical protein [Candidatus Sulfotelmatobacter sp.]
MRKAMIAVVLFLALNSRSFGQQAPARIDVAPVNVQNQLGAEAPVRLQLLDSDGHPAPATRSTSAELKVEQPSGQVTTYAVTFAPGESAKQISVPVDAAGLAKLTVKQNEQQLIGGSNYMLIRPGKTAAHKMSHTKQKLAGEKKAGSGAWLGDLPMPRRRPARLIFAAFPDPQIPAPASPSVPQLALTVSGEDANGGTRADGTTCARVQAFYLGADDLTRDIEVWLTFDHGALDNNPIVIHKGTTSGAACWTSQWPIPAATLGVATTKPPNYTVLVIGSSSSDSKTITHKFSDNILGIEFANAPASITLVDNFPLTARFKGPNGAAKLTEKRDVHFNTDNAALTLNPLQTFVDVGGFDCSTILIPTFFGRSTVQVSTPGYPTVSLVITITWLSVLLTSLLGGFLGGVLAWINSKGNFLLRVLTGLIVGLVASWAYVIVGLPKLETAFLHNRLSVFFVALLVGLSGVKGLSVITSKLKLPAF